MTKIGKTMITVKGEIHPVEIHYNRERKFFYRGVPDEVIALSSFRNRDYASEKELTQALSIALEQYHEKIKVQRLSKPDGTSGDGTPAPDRGPDRKPVVRHSAFGHLRHGAIVQSAL